MSPCLFHDTDGMPRDRRIFELVEQAYGRREKVVIFASGGERADAIDRMLWIHKQESFIPHQVFRNLDPESSLTVAIVTEELNPIGAGTLIADGHCPIEFALHFTTIHEFVDRTSPEIQEACRDRFRAYRARNRDPKHLK